MKNFIILGLFSYLFILSFNDWKLISKLDNSLYNPQNIWFVNDSSLVINDLANSNSPVQLLNTKNDEVTASLRTGRGPSETSSTFYKHITSLENKLMLWDAGLNRISMYDHNLNHIDDFYGSALESKFYQAGVINDSTFFTIDGTNEFLKVWRFKSNQINKKDLLWSISIDDYEEFEPLSNFILLQTFFYTSSGGATYFSFEFSSIIFAIDERGLKFINDAPDNIPLPIHDENQVFSLPVMGEHPEGSRDISVDDNFIYVLFNGKTISKFEQIRYSMNFEKLIEKVKHSQRVLIYDKNTGEFVKEIELPKPAMKMSVRGNRYFLLNSLGQQAVIEEYLFYNK